MNGAEGIRAARQPWSARLGVRAAARVAADLDGPDQDSSQLGASDKDRAAILGNEVVRPGGVADVQWPMPASTSSDISLTNAGYALGETLVTDGDARCRNSFGVVSGCCETGRVDLLDGEFSPNEVLMHP